MNRQNNAISRGVAGKSISFQSQFPSFNLGRCLVIILILQFWVSLGSSQQIWVSGKDLVSEVNGRKNLSILSGLIESAGLADSIRKAENITLFAPVNDAFSGLLIEASLPEKMGAIKVIEGQLSGFKAHNWTRAFNHASSWFHQYSTAASFGTLIQDHYSELMRFESWEVTSSVWRNGEFVNRVKVVDNHNLETQFDYVLGLEHGIWRVDGVTRVSNNHSSNIKPISRSELVNILSYHVATQEVSFPTKKNDIPTLLNQQALEVSSNHGLFRVNGKRIVRPNILTKNGFLHTIDSVLLPPQKATQQDAPSENIVEIAQGNDSFSTLVDAVVAAGLVDALSGDGPLTVFAPTNDAFAKLDTALVEALFANPAKLGEILTYHVVPAKVLEADIEVGTDVSTLNGATFQVTINGEGGPQIGSSQIIDTDIEATNGVIHVIDEVLIPDGFMLVDGPTQNIVEIAQGNDSFSTLVDAVVAAGLVDALSGDGPLTVFAPTNDAFAKLDTALVEALFANPSKLGEILTYHVVPAKVMETDIVIGADVSTLNGATFQVTLNGEGGPQIGSSQIIDTDIEATNGVIHVIDEVLIPDGFMLVDGPTQNIVEIAQGNDSFSTLVDAVVAAGLVDALSGDGPLTVFAPTNDAFAKLDTALVEALFANPSKLGEILTYHVVPAKVLEADIEVGADVSTLNGATFQVTLNGEGGPQIGSSQIIDTDIEATNGVIHVIDEVLIPDGFMLVDGPTQNIVEIAQGNDSFSTLVDAVVAAGLVDALSGDGPLTVFAPTNDAFAKLDTALVEALFANPSKLGEILTYHVVPAKVLEADIEVGADVSTLNGATFQVTLNGEGGPQIGSSQIIDTDIEATNGVIHVIDEVLIPEGFSLGMPGDIISLRLDEGDSNFNMLILSEDQQNYLLQSSSNLEDWDDVETIAGTGNIIRTLITFNESETAKFFRVVSQ